MDVGRQLPTLQWCFPLRGDSFGDALGSNTRIVSKNWCRISVKNSIIIPFWLVGYSFSQTNHGSGKWLHFRWKVSTVRGMHFSRKPWFWEEGIGVAIAIWAKDFMTNQFRLMHWLCRENPVSIYGRGDQTSTMVLIFVDTFYSTVFLFRLANTVVGWNSGKLTSWYGKYVHYLRWVFLDIPGGWPWDVIPSTHLHNIKTKEPSSPRKTIANLLASNLDICFIWTSIGDVYFLQA